MKTASRIGAISAAVVIAAAGSVGGVSVYRSNKLKNNKVAVVKVGNLSYGSAGGERTFDAKVISGSIQQVRPSEAAEVKKVFVSEGDEVKKGDVLLEYDMTVVNLDVKQKEANQAAAENNLRIADLELKRLQGLKTSEQSGGGGGGGDYWEDDEEYIEEEDNSGAKAYISEIYDACGGKGTMESPYQFICNSSTAVDAAFLNTILTEGLYTQFIVFIEGAPAYYWAVSPETLTGESLATWLPATGITMGEDGGIRVSKSVHMYGDLKIGGEINIDYSGVERETETETVTEPESVLPETEYIPPETEYIEPVTEYAEEETEGTEGGSEGTDSNTLEIFSFLTAKAAADEAAEEEDMGPVEVAKLTKEDENYMYSAAELKKKIKEQEIEIKNLEIEKKKIDNALENAKEKQKNGKEYSKIDGVITKLADKKDFKSGDIFLTVQGSGSTTISGNIAENYIDSVNKGADLVVSSWMTGEEYTAEITEVGNIPVSYSNENGNSSPNNSIYTFTAEIPDNSTLTVGDDVTVTASVSEESSGVSIASAFVREEDGRSYVMMADEKGRLKKQYVTTGSIISGGYAIEILSGLSEDDKICFPYGKNVREGAYTEEKNSII